ncbi:bifunctional acyl-ACP--phospholipid O-acyltransferase/long-chain-fatty-acid--ACP ligase [Sulfuriferula thiophila]|uniref:bifunctional acyl-ACP--phospholipid O-acyltransferase/long-chain-fatty-acid--ACP ligase n=1 Tax=Sulfuriferula thiophila TaxID=1781211 RepID=UPI000F60CBDB|nr:bifunctional acyl-ACP--phospholipid O-acyltransferase/long-chain-fatty-acid--ACP ligase [Sulfuriferula thiophila]
MVRTVIKAVLRWICRILFRVRVEGDLQAFDHPRSLIVANHESFLDGVLLGLFLPVEPVFIVHSWVAEHPILRQLLRLVEYLAVDPTQPMAVKKILRLVESGRPVVIFPEGRITLTGSLMKVYDGPAFIAAKTGAAVIPVRLDGPARSYFSRLTGDYPHHLFPAIRISVQPAVEIAMPQLPSAKMRRKQSGEALRVIMQNMLFHSRPRQTLWQALIETMGIYGSKRKMIEDMRQTPMSYRTLWKLSLAIARVLERETATGERVGVLLPNLAATVGVIFGLSALNRVAAMINYTSGRDGMTNACIAAEVRLILTSRAFLEKAGLTEVVQGLAGIKLFYLEDVRESLRWTDKVWLVLGTYYPRLILHAGNPESAAVVLFTSGSEGKPKGVVLSHRALLSNVAQVRAVIDMQPTDKVFNALPMFHSFGLTGGTLMPILTGMNVFLYPSPLHYRIIPELVYDKSCTILFGTGTFLGNYAKYAHPYDFYRLRYVVAGAEKVSDSVRDMWFEKFGIRILEGYGATETAPVLAVNTPMAYKKNSVGQLLPGIDSKILPVPGIGVGGMLYVSGPNLMSGYLRAEHPGVLERPKSALGEGWYETGDIVEKDEQGFIHIIGRVKRFAKVAGEMVSLEVVENIAALASPLYQHAATTQADAQRGEAILLYSVDKEMTRERLQQTAKENGFPEVLVPRKVIHVDVLPLLGTGKVDYVTLNIMGGGV